MSNLQKIAIGLLSLITVAIVVMCVILAKNYVTYYDYYEVDSPETATTVSLFDGLAAPGKRSPSRVIAAYPDSTGHTVYLMETKVTKRVKDIDDIDFE